MPKVLTFDAVYETLPAQGWLTRAEAELLWQEAARTEGCVLEVGCYCGRSTVLLASLGRPVYAVDPLDGFDDDLTGDEVEAVLRRNLRERKIRNVELFRVPVLDWEPRPVGFAYLDGPHDFQGTLDQIEKALACGPQAIGVHDVNDHGEGLDIKRAAVELLGAWHERVERLAVWRLGEDAR